MAETDGKAARREHLEALEAFRAARIRLAEAKARAAAFAKRYRPTDADEAAFVAAGRAGASLRVVARRFGVGQSTVHRAWKKHDFRRSDEAILADIAAANLRRVQSVDARQKIADSLKGKVRPQHVRDAIARGQKAAWARGRSPGGTKHGSQPAGQTRQPNRADRAAGSAGSAGVMAARTPVSLCPRCGYAIDAATPLECSAGGPRPGDISLCLGCGAVAIFADDLRLRPPALGEVERIAIEDPEAWAQIRRAQARQALLPPRRERGAKH